ncbi:MAG: hypothetical protein ACRDJH_02560 [Thermomicrobiales bacterium]
MAVSLDRTSEIVALRQHYRFYDDAGVIASLRRHPELVPLLQQAATRIPEFFPEDTTLRLEVLEDPDDEEGWESKLYAVIETTLPLPDARAKLYQFRDQWWQDASDVAVGLLSLVAD